MDYYSKEQAKELHDAKIEHLESLKRKVHSDLCEARSESERRKALVRNEIVEYYMKMTDVWLKFYETINDIEDEAPLREILKPVHIGSKS